MFYFSDTFKNASLPGFEAEQQPEGVAISSDGVGACLALADEPVGEERLKGRGERRHRAASKAASNRSAARRSSSGEAERYQYVEPGSTWPR